MFYFHRIPSVIQMLFSQRIWHIRTDEKVIFITFDDGPHPSLTPQILDLLSKFRAKVTFFQLGSKIEQFPALHKKCVDKGHTIGNHGYHHVDSLHTTPKKFLRNLKQGKAISKSNLYRPAFGRIPLFYQKDILKDNKVIMWHIMPGDFDYKMSIERCTSVINKYVRNGSIIVLHENEKAKDKVIPILEKTLQKFSKEGYTFKALPSD